MLEEKLLAQDARVTKNTQDIRDLLRELQLMRSEFEQMINEVGNVEPGMGNLGDLEDEIKSAGGLNIGDRWRLRFKEGDNKDFFIQDR